MSRYKRALRMKATIKKQQESEREGTTHMILRATWSRCPARWIRKISKIKQARAMQGEIQKMIYVGSTMSQARLDL